MPKKTSKKTGTQSAKTRAEKLGQRNAMIYRLWEKLTVTDQRRSAYALCECANKFFLSESQVQKIITSCRKDEVKGKLNLKEMKGGGK